MEIDNTIVVERDYGAVREAFLAEVENDKIREMIASLDDLPYYYPQLFPRTSGWGAKGEIKRRIKLLKTIEPTVKNLLLTGEEVRFVTTGIFSSFLEQYFLGYIAYLINRTVFVFTNYRIVMMNSNSRHVPLQMKWHIPYDQIVKFKAGGFISAATVFKLKDKKKYVFAKMPKADRKLLREFVTGMMERADTEDFHLPHFQGRDNLCPNCLQPVPPKTYDCEKCSEEFIKPSKPALMSLCLPCLGNFYLGHWLIGIFELVGYIVVGFVLIVMWQEDGVAAIPIILVVLAAEHGFDALMTYHIAKKGLISTRKAWRSH